MRRNPIPVKTIIIKAPKIILKFYHLITLAIDIFFVNNVPFLTTMFIQINFGTVKHITDITEESVFRCIGNILILYNKRGFKNETILADP